MLQVIVDIAETDEQIATRLVWKGNYPPGTVIGLESTKWVVQENKRVREIPRLSDTNASGPQVGQVYRPKDPRRKSSFTIKAVHEDSVEGEDGRIVKMDRLGRYSLVG